MKSEHHILSMVLKYFMSVRVIKAHSIVATIFYLPFAYTMLSTELGDFPYSIAFHFRRDL